GRLQANSIKYANGKIELAASGAVNLGTGSQIIADGDPSVASTTTEGSVMVNATSAITVNSGAGIEANGGQISLNSSTVNQNGTLQANSIQNVAVNQETLQANLIQNVG